MERVFDRDRVSLVVRCPLPAFQNASMLEVIRGGGEERLLAWMTGIASGDPDAPRRELVYLAYPGARPIGPVTNEAVDRLLSDLGLG